MFRRSCNESEQKAIEHAFYDVLMAVPRREEISADVPLESSEADTEEHGGGGDQLWSAVSMQTVIDELRASLMASEKLTNYLRQDKEKCQEAMRASGERHRREVAALQQQLLETKESCELHRVTIIELNQKLDAHAEVILRQEQQMRHLKTQLRHSTQNRSKTAEKERSLRCRTSHELTQENLRLRHRCETLRVELNRCRAGSLADRTSLNDSMDDAALRLRYYEDIVQRLRDQVSHIRHPLLIFACIVVG